MPLKSKWTVGQVVKDDLLFKDGDGVEDCCAMKDAIVEIKMVT